MENGLKMESGLKYVCDIDDSSELQKAYEELREFQKRKKEQGKFIDKLLRDLWEEDSRRWKNLFEAARIPGNIDPKIRFDEVSLRLADDGKQLLMSKSEIGPFGQLLDDLLKS